MLFCLKKIKMVRRDLVGPPKTLCVLWYSSYKGECYVVQCKHVFTNIHLVKNGENMW